jgi:ABC-type transport system involved in multi-copper enzyme maturation permease subunit
LFTGLALLQLLLILLVTPSSVAGAISGERQRQTWDLLLITRLSTFGIVWGKLASGVAFQILLMFSALPIFSLVFLFGGVSPGDIFHVYLVSVLTALFVGSISIFISSISRRTATAIIIANLVTLVLALGLSLLEVFLQVLFRHPQYGSTVPLSPFAQVDPFIGLYSALPNPSGGYYLSNLDWVHHSFIFFGTIPEWEAYSIVTFVISCCLIGLASFFARSRTRWLSRGAA